MDRAEKLELSKIIRRLLYEKGVPYDLSALKKALLSDNYHEILEMLGAGGMEVIFNVYVAEEEYEEAQKILQSVENYNRKFSTRIQLNLWDETIDSL